MTTITEDIQTLEPGSLITLWELNAANIGGGILRFHGHRHGGPIIWQGLHYNPWPIDAKGFARASDQQPTPSLSVANVDGSITLLCLQFDDMVGARMIRRRTFRKYLDADNFNDPSVIKNGDFGAGANYWTLLAGTGVPVDNAYLLGKPSGVSALYQEIPTVPGAIYTLRFYVMDMVCNTRIGSSPTTDDMLPYGVATIGYNERTFVATGTSAFVQFVRLSLGANPPSRLMYISVKHPLGNATADPDQQFPEEVWFIERKAVETREVVEFELSSVLNFQGVELPGRQIIANHCTAQYRQEGCEYDGSPVANAMDEPTSDPLQDVCGYRLASCKLRIWPDGILNFNGFPAAALARL